MVTMWLAARLIAVAAAALVWTILASYTLFVLGVGVVTFEPEHDFGVALNEAQIDAWRKDLSAPLPAACGYPGGNLKASFELTHSEVVHVARCLHRGGYLSAEGVSRVERSQDSLFVDCPGEAQPPGQVEIESSFCLVSYPWEQRAEHRWLSYAIVLGGLPLVVWLVGFRLPWPRRGGPVQTISDRREA